jgi:hypothetical protein
VGSFAFERLSRRAEELGTPDAICAFFNVDIVHPMEFELSSCCGRVKNAVSDLGPGIRALYESPDEGGGSYVASSQ